MLVCDHFSKNLSYRIFICQNTFSYFSLPPHFTIWDRRLLSSTSYYMIFYISFTHTHTTPHYQVHHKLFNSVHPYFLWSLFLLLSNHYFCNLVCCLWFISPLGMTPYVVCASFLVFLVYAVEKKN